MAGASLLTLIDDIATLLDDVAAMTKVATQKTVGVLGDDLALNAEQVSGVRSEREWPVVWAVAKGSLINKAILVPSALAISAVAPWLIVPLLMCGGLYLCYEGAEKIVHRQHGNTDAAQASARRHQAHFDAQAVEHDKIKGAIRTDFILSAEIIVITLGTLAAANLTTQMLTLVSVAVLMTLGVYGLVAVIVKLDDLGVYCQRQKNRLVTTIGALLLRLAPWLMRSLSWLGMLAMFLVGGGILVHGLPQTWQARLETLALPLGKLAEVVAPIIGGVIGLVSGLVLVTVVSLLRRRH